MFVYHFVDLDLRVKLFFEKERAAENRGVDFEIRDISISANLYWRSKKISCRACLFFYHFIGDKKISFSSGHYWILLICLATVECVKYRGSRAIVDPVSLVPSYLHESEIFFLGYFVAPKYFLMGIS